MKYITMFIVVLICSVRLSAQNEKIKTYFLDTVKITASKYEQAYKNLNPSTSYIQNEELSNAAKNAAFSSLSGRTAGVFVTERENEGYGISMQSAGKISVRGISGTQQILVSVDGKPEFSGFFGHPLPDGYMTSETEAVEVIRGPASVIYGSGAMGGAINIITKKNLKPGFNLSADVNYGTFNTLKWSTVLGYKTNDISARLSLNEDKTDGSRPSSSFDSKVAALNLQYFLNANWNVGLDGYVNRSKSYNPGTIASPYLNNSAWTDVTRANIALLAKDTYENIEGETRIFFNNGVHDIYDGFHSNDNTLGFSTHQGFTLFNSSIITAGADFKRYGGIGSVGAPVLDTMVTEEGIFAMITQHVTEQIRIDGGIRLHNHSAYGSIVVPQINIQYSPAYNTIFHIEAAKGFRNPALTELYLSPVFQPYKGINPDLKPEKTWNYEAGVWQKFFSEKLSFGLTGFLIEGSDLITSTGVYPTVVYGNINKFRNRGIEFESSYHIFAGLSLTANYSYTDMDTKNTGSPKQQAFIEGVYTKGIFTFIANFTSISDLYTALQNAYGSEKKQSYSLLNGEIIIKPSSCFSVYLKGNNLLDKKYEIIAGYPMPGATATAGVSLSGIL